MSLLPLPKTQRLGDIPGHIDEALREYGQACRIAALEEAAQICEKYAPSFMNGDTVALRSALEIRSLK